ncbi:YgiQ family radical SAM protein [Sulfurimicrobium lacus]|nr:YgiQ family radical SAM protein [Sulfurimicrobium lacus]
MQTVPAITSHRKYWAKRFGTAPFLPTSREEMEALGWDSCDIIIVTGDAYIDHPSFGMALVGRLLEDQGFRVGVISQPDWHSPAAFKKLGKPNLFFGVTAGNMDSMVNRYTSDRKIRSDDAYTPDATPDKRPDRAVIVYSQRCREAYPKANIVIGSIEASLRRIAHYDYWSDKVRRSVLPDSKADMLIYGNAERALVDLSHRLAAGEAIAEITDLRGTAFMRSNPPPPPFDKGGSSGWTEVDSTSVEEPPHSSPEKRIPSPPQAGEGRGEGKHPAPPRHLAVDILAFARELRIHQTDAEELLWGTLRAKRFFNLKFRRQHPVGRYILDFFCAEKNLAIELDGGQHAEQVQHDEERSKFLQEQGIKVLRFWNNDVLQQTESVLESLMGALGLALPSPPAPLPLAGEGSPVVFHPKPKLDRTHTFVRIPSYEQVKDDAVLYAHASRILHLESNPGNARALVQAHGERDVWLNPPPIPLTTAEMDHVYGLPYARRPHPSYGEARIPAFEMIRFSINIMRGCFGGCTFCSITEHEGRIIQSRSEQSILHEIEEIRDKTPGYTGTISDLGGPTANMYRLHCKDEKIESACRRLSCVFPDICVNMGTDHGPLVQLYRKARAIPGVKRVLIGSGVRYDLAVKSPEYVKELVTHHVGGYLKIAPEHTEPGPLSKMMKPGIGTYDKFKAMFEKFSKEAGKEQYLIPYFIAAHPGTTDEDMLNLALWLKANGFRPDQVQAFLPTPMALASTMYHTHRNPLKKVTRSSEEVPIPMGDRQRRLHKAFLRYHDANNWPLLREALKRMGRSDLIGNGKKHLVPYWQPAGTGTAAEGTRRPGQQAQAEKKPTPTTTRPRAAAKPVKGSARTRG